MRILQVTDNYFPAVGGLERVVAALAAGLQQRGHLVEVATLYRADSPDDEFVAGVRVRRLRGWTRQLSRLSSGAEHQFHPTAPDPQLISALQRVITDFAPDVIHAHGWIANSVMSLRTDIPLVVTLHDYSASCVQKTMIAHETFDAVCAGPSIARCLPCAVGTYGAVKGIPLTLGTFERRRRFDRVSRFLAISDCVARAAPPDITADQVRVIPSFVDDAIVDVAADVPATIGDREFLLFVGALGEHKGVGTLAAAHRLMRTRVPLVFIGTPRADTPALDGPDMQVLTGVPHPQIMAAMSRAAAVVVPSRWAEPLGLVAVEAMCRGTAVVASDIGALPEVVRDGETGLLTPAGDPAALAAALDRVVSDPAAATRMGAAGRARVQRYLASEVIPQIVDTYRSVAADSARRACAAKTSE